MKQKVNVFSSLLLSLFIVLNGCKSEQIIEEISEETFTKLLENFNVSLNTFNTDIDTTEEIYITDAGSDSYQNLIKNIKEDDKYSFNSSKKTTFGYILNDSETIKNKMATSVADQTPEIYLLSGNKKYPTGKCSNVVALKAASKSNILIENCIFENMGGISLYDCDDIIIQNCYFKGAENGIYLAKCSNIEIKNCTFDMNTTGLTDYYQGVYLGDGNDTVTVSQCYFNADADIKKPYRVGSASTDEKSSINVTFTNCFSKGFFRSGFQNIDGVVSLNNCSFIFNERSAFNNAIIIDESKTSLSNCNFYSSYRKKISSNLNTTFTDCNFNLFSI